MLVLARRQGESLIIGVEILDADYDLTTFGEKEGVLGASGEWRGLPSIFVEIVF